MGYYTTSDNTRVYFQNGMDNHTPGAKVSSALLADLLKQPVGAIINASHGIGGDVKEIFPQLKFLDNAYKKARDSYDEENDSSSNS